MHFNTSVCILKYEFRLMTILGCFDVLFIRAVITDSVGISSAYNYRGSCGVVGECAHSCMGVRLIKFCLNRGMNRPAAYLVRYKLNCSQIKSQTFGVIRKNKYWMPHL